ncbi:DUF6148 family protein [Pectinatus frisingensis]|uniref:DUF6148 family protein n=1 Tax=Pectinatus frisingensis TaxID=865 RepID=UPI0018C60AAC|nr:DUF6148 family protein [Pectinatus frisingensis]
MNTLQNERLKQYYEAEKAVLSGQSYTIGNRTLTRANLATIRNAIDDLIAGGANIDGTTQTKVRRSARVVFRD